MLDGRAIQDIWALPARHERERSDLALDEHGCSLRFFDAAAGVWRVVWVGPVNGNLRTFTVRETSEEIHVEGESPDGARLRWTFSEIGKDRFTWSNRRSTDGGITWTLQESVNARRLNATALV